MAFSRKLPIFYLKYQLKSDYSISVSKLQQLHVNMNKHKVSILFLWVYHLHCSHLAARHLVTQKFLFLSVSLSEFTNADENDKNFGIS